MDTHMTPIKFVDAPPPTDSFFDNGSQFEQGLSDFASQGNLDALYSGSASSNWDEITPMTGSHIPGVDTGARGGQTTFMGSGGLQTVTSGMGSFGGGRGGAVDGSRFGGSGVNAANADSGSATSLQQTINQFDTNQQNQTAAFTQTLSDQTGQQALASVNASGLGQFNQGYMNVSDPYYYAGSVGELTRGIQYDANGMGAGAGSNSVDSATALSPGFTTPLDAQIKDNTGWFDYARSWINYASQVPSAASSLDYPTINAAIDAYDTAAQTNPGTPEFTEAWQTATAAIKTMVTVNGWTYGPATGQSPTGPTTLATINVTPTSGELADAGLSPQGSGATYGPLDDLRGLGDAMASGVANVDRGIAHFNGVVNDGLVDQGAQDLRDGNRAGFIWNGIKYSFYNTFMPNSVEGTVANLAGGAVAGKVAGLGLKAAAGLFARGIWSSSANQLAKAGFKSVEEFADAVGNKYQQLYDEGYAEAQRALQTGKLRVPPRMPVNTALGQYTDKFARDNMTEWLKGMGVSEGPDEVIQINRYLLDPMGSGRYRIPDVYVHGGNVNRIYDGTIGNKSWSSRQIQGFYRYSTGADIRITKPGELGGTRRIEPER